MNSIFYSEEKSEKRWTKKDGCMRRDINDVVFINEKEKKSATAKTVVREKISLYNSFSFFVTCYTTRHSLPPNVPFLFFYKRSFLYSFYQAQKFTNFCLFIYFRWFDIKSSKCFGGFSLISIILWEYCENNVKTFWYYFNENKQTISQKVLRLIFFWNYSKRSHQ